MDNKLRSIFWVLMWSACFSTAVSITKMISPEISIFTIVFVRLCFGLAIILPVAFQTNLSALVSQRLPLHGLRVLLHTAAIVCTYYAYSQLPLAFVTSIGFTAPIITVLLAMLILRDKVSSYQWFLVFLGYAGVLIMMRPGSIEYDIAIGAAIAANLLASASNIILKMLSSSDSTVQILAHTNVGTLALMSILTAFFWTTPSLNDLFYMCLLGCSGTLSQYCYVKAIKLSDPSKVAPYEYTRLIFAIPIGYFLFAEIPTIWTISGSLVIILSSVLLTLHETRKQTQTSYQ